MTLVWKQRSVCYTVLVVAMTFLLSGCGATQTGQKVRAAGNRLANSVAAVGADIKAGTILRVPRRIYLSENAEDTIIQRGYAVDRRDRDEFQPWCQFVLDLKLAARGDVDVTRIEADSFVVERTSRYQSQRNPVPLPAAGDSVLVATLALTNRITEMRIKSEKQPWVSRLKCAIFAGDEKPLDAKQIAKALAPTVLLELKQ